MPSKRISTKAIGDSFEKLVARHYEALGFKVTPNINVGGHQIDLLATKYLSGASQFGLMIEVKARPFGIVGINDVTPFLNTAMALLMNSDIQGAVLVTNGSFSQDARLSAHDRRGIRLLTMQELEQDLFNYSESLLKARYDYEASPIFRDYVPLEGEQETKKVKDVGAHVLRWSRGTQKLLIVVGDFGSGKSTILERVFYQQALARLGDSDARFPILLRLRKLLQYQDLWAFVSASLRDNQSISPTRSIFESQLASGQLLVFLDGFDEIHTGATAKDRASYLKTLTPILSSGSPCVLSTRPTYFESFDEMTSILTRRLARMPAFDRLSDKSLDIEGLLDRLNMNSAEKLSSKNLRNVVRLSHLTDDKVTEYLKKFEAELWRTTGATTNEVKAFLYRIYDLEDLMRRPLLLHMVVATIIAGRVDISNKNLTLGPSTLYDLYTQISAKRDANKNPRGQFLSEAERLLACRGLAMRMLDKGSIELRGVEVHQAVAKALLPTVINAPAKSRATALDGAITDVRVCSFLSYSDDDSLRFAHKSYFEFFVAQDFVLGCQNTLEPLDSFSKRTLAKEIIYFLGSFARDLESFGQMIVAALHDNRSDARVRLLCYRIAFASGVLLEKLRTTAEAIEDVELRRADVANAVFSGVAFRNVSIREVQAKKWALRHCVLYNVTLELIRFTASELQITADDCEIEHSTLDESQFFIGGNDWTIRHTEIRHTEVRLNGTGLLSAVNFEECPHLELGRDLRLAAGSSASFTDSRVVPMGEEDWYEEGASWRFDNCVLCGIRLRPSDIFALVGKTRSEDRLVTLKKCRGIVLTTGYQKDYTPLLRKSYPGLVVCDIDELQRALEWREASSAARLRYKSDEGVEEIDLGSKLLSSVTEAITSNNLRNFVVGRLARVIPKTARAEA